MTWRQKLGFTLSLMLSDRRASLRGFGVLAPDFPVSFNPTYELPTSHCFPSNLQPSSLPPYSLSFPYLNRAIAPCSTNSARA